MHYIGNVIMTYKNSLKELGAGGMNRVKNMLLPKYLQRKQLNAVREREFLQKRTKSMCMKKIVCVVGVCLRSGGYIVCFFLSNKQKQGEIKKN